MLPTNVMSFMKKMVATDDSTVPGQIDSTGTFGKLRQTLSSSLLTAQDKVTKLGPRCGVEVVEPPMPTQPPPVVTAPPKTEREAGKAPSRVGACRVCLKALKPGEVFHTCNGCHHRVCEDCSSYSKPLGDDDVNTWRCSVCRRKAVPRLPPSAQDSTDSLLDVPVLDALQRRHSEARLGSGASSSSLAPPRSPELRRHSDVSPASLKELEKLKGSGSKTPGQLDSRRPSIAIALSPVRRRSVRTPRQRSCEDDNAEVAPATINVASISRRASAVDVLAGGVPSRRSSYRADDQEIATQISGLSVNEDKRPIRRRGSQLPDIAALQQRTSPANMSPRIDQPIDSASRQMSVDAEAIKIVIHDVDDRVPRRVTLRRGPKDMSYMSRGFGMRMVGGKPDGLGRRETVILFTAPGGPADLAGLKTGDKVLEWGGVRLSERSHDEVCSVVERTVGDSVDVVVVPSEVDDVVQATPQHQPPPQLLLNEPDTDKSLSSPTRRKLPKTPEKERRERPPPRAQLQVRFDHDLRKLAVLLVAADDLPSRDHKLGYGDEPEAFARIRLLPSLESCPPVETDPASASCSPVWNARLAFGGLNPDLIAGRALELTLWDACPGIDPVLIGECTMELEKAFAEERPVWWTLEERGSIRSASASPRGSLTGLRSLRRGDFASQRSISDDVDSIGECASLLHPDHAWVAGSRRGSSQSETLEVEVYQLGKDFSRSLPGSRRSSFQQQEGKEVETIVSRRGERRRSSCIRRDPDEILRSLRAVKGELGRTLSLTGSTARRTATGRKGSMWAAMPSATALDHADDDCVALGPGQLPPRAALLPPLHAEINISIIMVKGQLELEVSHARRVYGVNGEVPDSYVKCYLRDGEKWLHKRKTRVIRRTTEPHFNQTLKYQANEALGRTLIVMLWQRCGGFEHNLALGGAEISLDKLTLQQRTYGWYPLYPATCLADGDDASVD